jgi:hypothetical protein
LTPTTLKSSTGTTRTTTSTPSTKPRQTYHPSRSHSLSLPFLDASSWPLRPVACMVHFLARAFSGGLAAESIPNQRTFRDRTRELSWDDPGVDPMDRCSKWIRMRCLINSDKSRRSRLFADLLFIDDRGGLRTCFV